MNDALFAESVSDGILEILDELDRACVLHPDWPSDIVHQAAIVAEEAGEALQAANNHLHHGADLDLVRREMIQCGAMCLRWMQNNPGKAVVK